MDMVCARVTDSYCTIDYLQFEREKKHHCKVMILLDNHFSLTAHSVAEQNAFTFADCMKKSLS